MALMNMGVASVVDVVDVDVDVDVEVEVVVDDVVDVVVDDAADDVAVVVLEVKPKSLVKIF